jgi:diphthine synthase
MLTFIGMGLYDEKDISIKGYEKVKEADEVYIEFYTSKLVGTTRERLEEFFGREIVELRREDLEDRSRELVEKARHKDIVLLIPGDVAVATTHSSIMLEARQKGVDIQLIHGASIVSAVCGLTGLHNYRFGKSATVAYPYGKTVSRTPIRVILDNWSINAHTLLYLDLHPEPMTIAKAVEILKKADDDKMLKDAYAVGLARAGSEKPVVRCDRLYELPEHDFGDPLYIMVVLAKKLHITEYEFLSAFANAPHELSLSVE